MAATTDTFDPFGLQSSGPGGIGLGGGGAGDFRNGHHHAGGQRRGTFDPFDVQPVLPKRDRSGGPESPKDDGALSLPPEVSRVTRQGGPGSKVSLTATKTIAGGASIQIPPKLMVKLSIHEEVSSVAITDAEGASEISVEGSIYAQLQCSDAKKNAPFVIQPKLSSAPQNLTLRPDPKFTQAVAAGSPEMLVSIPKQEIGFVPVARYTLTENVMHMPLLLERKVTFNDNICRIAVQVRSKLTNSGDLEDFTLALAVPEHIDGDSIEVVRGDGSWDSLKRIVKWRLPALKKGESFMVSAQGRCWRRYEGHQDISFPVLLRCSASSDQISSVAFEAIPAHGHPASVTTTTGQNAFQLLHRLA